MKLRNGLPTMHVSPTPPPFHVNSCNVIAVFTVAALLSAFLLFALQPIVAKILLPELGGVPAVWTTCQLFFQLLLLAGYAYVHLIARFALQRALPVHLVVLLVGTLFSPSLLLHRELHVGHPAAVLATLLATVLMPTLALAASAPLLQWMLERSGDQRSPYPLYAASNVGSLSALLSYPFLIEPSVSLSVQAQAWNVGYIVETALLTSCVVLALRAQTRNTGRPSDITSAPETRPSQTSFVRLVLLAFVPASLLLGATTYASTDFSPVPLLWVVPLALYLLTYVIAFAAVPRAADERTKRVFVLCMALLFLPMLPEGAQPAPLLLAHFVLLFLGSLIFHRELALRRPAAAELTGFYLAIATGGALAGVLHAFIAPLMFSRPFEYPLTLVLACAITPFSPKPSAADREQHFAQSLGVKVELSHERVAFKKARLHDAIVPAMVLVTAFAVMQLDLTRTNHILYGLGVPFVAGGLFSLGRPVRFALVMGALLFVTHFDRHVVAQGRSFLGSLRVEDLHAYRVMFHGTTIHGRQHRDPARRREPNTYYTRDSPVGRAFALRKNQWTNAQIAVVGLGTGTLATYAQAGQHLRFYELDPLVDAFAHRYFTYLADCPAPVEVVLGDARVALKAAPAHVFDLLIVDAFSSDSIPVHLLTREALSVYMRALRPEGLLLVHATNRYLRIADELVTLARDSGLAALVATDRVEHSAARVSSTWVAMATRAERLSDLRTDGTFKARTPSPPLPVWTDDYSSVLSALRVRD